MENFVNNCIAVSMFIYMFIFIWRSTCILARKNYSNWSYKGKWTAFHIRYSFFIHHKISELIPRCYGVQVAVDLCTLCICTLQFVSVQASSAGWALIYVTTSGVQLVSWTVVPSAWLVWLCGCVVVTGPQPIWLPSMETPVSIHH
jgi:hypothetical protein